MHSYRAFWLFFLSLLAITATFAIPGRVIAQQTQPPPQQPRIVENVDIIGNRRLRKDDILYYIQTRPGDPYNVEQVQRDYQTLLSLTFFDKTETRVLTENGPRGGVNIIFEVKELPIIRDLTFEGLKSVAESDVLKAFRERRVGVSKESIYDPVKVRNAMRVIKELLSAGGHPNATVTERTEEVSATSLAITFDVNEGDRVRVVDIQFEGNTVFSDGSLRGAMKYVKEAGLITRFKSSDILDREKLEYDLRLAGIQPGQGHEHDNTIGHFSRSGHVVSDHDTRHRMLATGTHNQLIDHVTHDRIQPRRWFIVEHQIGFQHKCSCQSNSLSHTAR